MGASPRSWREHAAPKKLITDPCAVSIADKPVSCILPEHRAATVRNNARPVSARVCALSSRIRRTNAQPGHLELRHGTALALPIRARDTRQGCHRGTGRDAQLRRGVSTCDEPCARIHRAGAAQGRCPRHPDSQSQAVSTSSSIAAASRSTRSTWRQRSRSILMSCNAQSSQCPTKFWVRKAARSLCPALERA